MSPRKNPRGQSAKDIIAKYSRKLESQLSSPTSENPESNTQFSREYLQFKKDMIPEITRYEKWTKSLGNLIKIKVAEKDRKRIQSYLDTAKVEVTASQALTLSIVSMLSIFFLTLLTTTAIYFINGSIQLLLFFLGVLASVFIFYYTYNLPKKLATLWRLKASSEMVPAILYVVVYMKHTSNLERAIQFASEHLEGPLALDFKKIFYDVEVSRFSTIKASLENYLESWRSFTPEFVESFHLIESSLYEPSEIQRVQTLEKALQVILDGIYEKMLVYSRQIRSPLTNIYMLGIILPTLGLALLPLASALLGGSIQWPHIMVVFNILIPLSVIYLTSQVLLKRPGGYGESSILELNPQYKNFKSKRPWAIAFLIALPFLILGLLPFIFQISPLTSALGLQSDYTFQDLGFSFFADTKLFDFKTLSSGKLVGPFGPLAVLLSLFIPLSIALFFSISYRLKTSQIIKSRNKTKALEKEFTNSLFQLGNRLGDGTPAEIAFSKVAQSTQGQETQQFFSLVNTNIQQAGMSLERAIFHKKRGAIIYFPSSLIATSMKILIESVKKGLKVAARSLMSISQYLKNIQKINARLQDLLAEIVSDMKSNMTFLAPLLAGIVVGLATMITLILNKLQTLQLAAGSGSSAGIGNLASVFIFNVEQMIPPYFVQLVIGVYIIEIIFILTSTLVIVNSGPDILKQKSDLSKNLIRGVSLYLITAFIAIASLTLLGSIALGGIAG